MKHLLPWKTHMNTSVRHYLENEKDYANLSYCYLTIKDHWYNPILNIHHVNLEELQKQTDKYLRIAGFELLDNLKAFI